MTLSGGGVSAACMLSRPLDKVQISFTVCGVRSAGFQPADTHLAGWKPALRTVNLKPGT